MEFRMRNRKKHFPHAGADRRSLSAYASCLLIVLLAAALSACTRTMSASNTASEPDGLCSPAWYASIESRVATGDGQGHGPDLGSDEWKSVVEFRLGIRDTPGVPPRNSQDWCGYIDRLVRSAAVSSSATGPSYECGKVEAGSIEALICENPTLSALDRKLSGVYIAASRIAINEHPPRLKAEQRGWIKGRNACWKTNDIPECVTNAYRHRIAELQARYRLLPGHGPFGFICNNNPANEIIATFFQTDPPTLIAERGDSISLMYLQPSASGARYQGRNESFWEHQGEATVVWGHQAPPLHCKKIP